MIIIKKIMKDLGKEKTFTFVMLMQIVLIASITLILSFTAVFFSPESLMTNDLKIGTLNIDNNLQNKIFKNDQKITLIDYDSFYEKLNEEYLNEELNIDEIFKKGISDIQKKEIDALIVLEEINPYVFAFYLPDSDIQASLIMSYLKEIFEIFENNLLLEKADVINLEEVRVIGRRDKGSDYIYEIIYGFLIPFLFLVPIFLVGSLIIDIVTQEIESKTILLIKSATSLKRYFNEVIIASLLMSFLQIIIWTTLIQIRGINLNNIPQLMIYLALFAFLISNLSLLISLKFKTKARSQLIYSVLIMLISVSIGVSQLNPVAFISTIVSGIMVAPLIGYVIIALIASFTYYILIKQEKKMIL